MCFIYWLHSHNTHVDDSHKTDTAMAINNLIEYSDAYSKTSGSLWQYFRDEPALELIAIIVFHSNLNSK